MSHIPEDVRVNIIARLPVKSIFKSRCISKTWKDIISTSYFKTLHEEISKGNNPQLLVIDQSYVNENEDETIAIHLASMEMDGNVHFSFQWLVRGYTEVFPSNNGLVGLSKYNQFFLFNPSVRQIVRLPQPSESILATVYAGLGYNDAKNQYIMIHLFDTNIDEVEYELKCEILTISEDEQVSSQSWKQMKGTCPFTVSGSGVYANNSFYWMVGTDCDHEDDELIISYNIDKEKFEVIPHPNVQSFQEDNDMLVVELKGFLCLIDIFAIPSKMDVWMLKDHKNNIWVKEMSVDLTNLEGFDDEMTQVIPLCYQEGNIVMAAGKEGVHYYNVGGQTFQKIRGINLSRESKICVYKETLFALKN